MTVCVLLSHRRVRGVGILIIVDILWLYFVLIVFFFFKQKTAYEMRISEWSSDVCSSDLADAGLLTPTEALRDRAYDFAERRLARIADIVLTEHDDRRRHRRAAEDRKSTRLNSSH